MAARTASVSGLWSNTATWGGSAVPVDGDSVVINTGIVVTYNADESGFATGIAGMNIQVTGTLKYITDGTVTYLKMAGNISGAGNLFIGNSDLDPIPAPSGSTPEVATLAFNGAFGIVLTGTVEMHGELRTPVVAISSKTDNTHIVVAAGGPTFRAGDVIGISDSTVIGKHSPASETFTVSSYNAGTREITLSSSLARSINQNSQIDVVMLISHNILVTNISGTNALLNAAGTTILIKGVRFSWLFAGGVGIYGSTGGSIGQIEFDYCSVDGSAFAVAAVLVSTAHEVLLTFCVFINVTTLTAAAGNTFQDSWALNCGTGGFSGLSSGIRLYCYNCTTALSTSTAPGQVFIACGVYNCSSGSTLASYAKLIDCLFGHNTTDLTTPIYCELFNCLLGDATEVSIGNSVPIWAVTQSFDHDQVTDAFKAWHRGGNAASVASPVYDSTRQRSYQHSPTSATIAMFTERRVLVPAGGSIFVRVYVQKDASMSYLPRVWVHKSSKEPILSGSPDLELIMTNSTNTWEVLEGTVTNSSSSPLEYKVRFVAKNASGSVYFDHIIRVSSFQIAADMVGGMIA